MRITFFAVKINLESGGGSHRTLDLKMRHLIEKGHTVKLVTFYSKGNLGIANAPYAIDELDYSGAGFLRLQKLVVEELKRQELFSDIFYMDGASFIWAGGKYKACGGKVPTVAFVNNYQASMGLVNKDYTNLTLLSIFWKKLIDFFYRLKRFIWEKTIGLRWVNCLDNIAFASPVIYKIYTDWGVKKEISTVLPDFVDVNKFSTLKKTNPFSGGFNLVYAGRFTHDKGVDLLVRAMTKLYKDDVYLNLIGGGSQLPYLKKLVSRYNLEDKVIIHSWQKPEVLSNYYAHADIFIYPSRWPEPFGRSVTEAMAYGVPVIASSGTGSAWALGNNGLVFSNGKLDDLIQKILEFKNNPQLRKEMGIAAKKRSQELDYRNYIQNFENILTSLLH